MTVQNKFSGIIISKKTLTVNENVSSQRGSHRQNVMSCRQNKPLFTPRTQALPVLNELRLKSAARRLNTYYERLNIFVITQKNAIIGT